ncbi:MAG TPA: D-amino acid dehydrogenase [Burkholderiaceae bacterium]|nr:D-amino acid dehydrogenase [Burkholderiaceae bacterium]
MKALVLGAGIIGVSTAWFLRKNGVDVHVIERRAGAGLETSFANGCQISVSYSEPWAAPSAPLKIAQWLFKPDAPLLFRPRLDPAQWLWALAFLRECTHERLRRNVAAMVALSTYSRAVLQATRAETGIAYDHLERGILRFYLDEKVFDAARPAAESMREFGVNRRVIDADEVVRIEPALAKWRSRIVGGDFTAEDETGDIYLFTRALAERAVAQGVRFEYDTQVTRLIVEGGRVAGVELIGPDGRYRVERADVVVVALGSHTPALLRGVGVRTLIYPAKGYSATYPIIDSSAAPTVSLTDDSHKIVFARLGNRLRVAGTAELNGYSRELNPVRCEALTRRTQELFPDACDYTQPEYWSALRPSTPSNVPIIGRLRYPNLYVNAGHGTLGWTMGLGSGRALADVLCEREPEVAFPFVGVGKSAK